MAERPDPVQDPIQRGLFRETEEGDTVFFPWGLAHRGYRLPGEAARRKAVRAAKLLVGSVLGVGVWGGHALFRASESGAPSLGEAAAALAGPLAALALALAAYALWAQRFVEGLPPSDLRVSREARLREAAKLAGPGKVTAVGALLVALSALLLLLEPRAGWLAALGVASGAALALWGLVLRRAARRVGGSG